MWPFVHAVWLYDYYKIFFNSNFMRSGTRAGKLLEFSSLLHFTGSDEYKKIKFSRKSVVEICSELSTRVS